MATPPRRARYAMVWRVAGVLGLLAIGAGPGPEVTALASNAPTSNRVAAHGCYTERRRAYPFPFTAAGSSPTQLPNCRQTKRGKIDVSAGRGDNGAGADTFRNLVPDSVDGGDTSWAVRDSFGNPFAWIHASGTADAPSGWALYATGPAVPATPPILSTAVIAFNLQGQACSVVGDHEAVILVNTWGIHGFIEVDALPVTGDNGQPVKARWNGNPNPQTCGDGQGLTKVRDTTAHDQTLTATDKYIGTTSNQRGCDIQHPVPCGTYANYHGPASVPPVVLIESATTGVTGGGVMRAIVPEGMAGELLDSISYNDPNVPCNQMRTARWYFARFSQGAFNIYGWFPIRRQGKVTAC